jgi:3-oxoacyl-[acyl-carrier-protein] synthase III
MRAKVTPGPRGEKTKKIKNEIIMQQKEDFKHVHTVFPSHVHTVLFANVLSNK